MTLDVSILAKRMAQLDLAAEEGRRASKVRSTEENVLREAVPSSEKKVKRSAEMIASESKKIRGEQSENANVLITSVVGICIERYFRFEKYALFDTFIQSVSEVHRSYFLKYSRELIEGRSDWSNYCKQTLEACPEEMKQAVSDTINRKIAMKRCYLDLWWLFQTVAKSDGMYIFKYEDGYYAWLLKDGLVHGDEFDIKECDKHLIDHLEQGEKLEGVQYQIDSEGNLNFSLDGGDSYYHCDAIPEQFINYEQAVLAAVDVEELHQLFKRLKRDDHLLTQLLRGSHAFIKKFKGYVSNKENVDHQILADYDLYLTFSEQP